MVLIDLSWSCFAFRVGLKDKNKETNNCTFVIILAAVLKGELPPLLLSEKGMMLCFFTSWYVLHKNIKEGPVLSHLSAKLQSSGWILSPSRAVYKATEQGCCWRRDRQAR